MSEVFISGIIFVKEKKNQEGKYRKAGSSLKACEGNVLEPTELFAPTGSVRDDARLKPQQPTLSSCKGES